MNEKQQMYEAPVTQFIVVKTKGGILQGSIKATRDSYGSAQTDEWN
ncbi:MAG: hypothetical protein IKX67_09255 [Bacteroidales bacterium]|nr:hypothetical protein [Bacteroidales bacterium]